MMPLTKQIRCCTNEHLAEGWIGVLEHLGSTQFQLHRKQTTPYAIQVHQIATSCTTLQHRCTALHTVVQHHTQLYNSAHSSTALQHNYATLHTVVQHYTQLYNTAHSCTALHTVVQHCTQLYSTAHSWTTLHTVVQHCNTIMQHCTQ